MSGTTGYVVPFPLYYNLGQDSLFAQSQRYLDVLRKIDPELAQAPIQGWNALWRVGTLTGMLLAALGWQITEASALLQQPTAFLPLLRQLPERYPETATALAFLADLARLNAAERAALLSSFLNKIALFQLQPTTTAIFGAAAPGLSWAEVLEQRLAVLCDFRAEFAVETLRFKMLWVYQSFLDFIKHRGAGQEHQPVSLIIDELSYLLSLTAGGHSLFAPDLDELLNRVARNYMLWPTLAYQQLSQADLPTQRTLLGMGTQVLGVTPDHEVARTIARRYFRFDPQWVRKEEVVPAAHGLLLRTTEYSVEEQAEINSFRFHDLPPQHFFVILPGQKSPRLLTTSGLDPGLYPDTRLLEEARALLARRAGQPVPTLLQQIAARTAEALASPPRLRRREPLPPLT
jgi:hypothetical protein